MRAQAHAHAYVPKCLHSTSSSSTQVAESSSCWNFLTRKYDSSRPFHVFATQASDGVISADDHLTLILR